MEKCYEFSFPIFGIFKITLEFKKLHIQVQFLVQFFRF